MSKPETFVEFVTQISFSEGVEWQPWSDMPGQEETLLEAIRKADMFHYFMVNGTYPSAHVERLDGVGLATLAIMQKIRASTLVDRKRDNIKSRTRIVKRTYVVQKTDEPMDETVLVQHGSKIV